MMLLSICIIVITLPKKAKFRYEIEKGRVCTQNDLVSPYNFAILKTAQELENDRRIALDTAFGVAMRDALRTVCAI